MIRLYTDGSCRDTDNGPRVGWAWVAVDFTDLPFEKGVGTVENATSRNVSGEIQAVMNGLDYLDEQGIRNVTVYHDYYGISKWITGEWEAKIPLTKQYKRFVNHLQKGGMDIRFRHIKAHSEDNWNEYVDRLAKEAIGL